MGDIEGLELNSKNLEIMREEEMKRMQKVRDKDARRTTDLNCPPPLGRGWPVVLEEGEQQGEREDD